MLRTAAYHAKQALTVPQYYGRGLLKVFTTDPVFLWAQAIAFKTLVTLLPLILLAVGIFGQVLRQEDAFTTVSQFLRGFLPPAQSDGLVDLVFQLQEASGAITTFGALFFIATVITMFATLRYVVGAAMGESRHQMRSILGGYVFDLRMVAQVGSLFLLSFGITTAARFLSARSGELAARVGLDPGFVGTATGGLLQTVTFLVPYLLTVGMMAQLYFFVPRPKPPKRSALAGAAAAAILFELAKNGFTYYATYVADFDRYADSGEGLGGLGGAFGLILAFVFWVYLSGLILVAGAVVAALHERRVRPRKSRLRKMWAQKAGAFRKHRERVEAEAVEAVHESVGNGGRPEPSAAPEVSGAGGDALPDAAARSGPVPASS
jgi:membrane protein